MPTRLTSALLPSNGTRYPSPHVRPHEDYAELRPPRRQLRLFVLHAPRLRTLHLSGVESWPAPIAENLPRICLGFGLNPGFLGRDLKDSPSLREIAINGVYRVLERVGTKLFKDLFDSRRATHLDGLGECFPSLFALGSTNYLQNLDDITDTRLKLVDCREDPCAKNVKDDHRDPQMLHGGTRDVACRSGVYTLQSEFSGYDGDGNHSRAATRDEGIELSPTPRFEEGRGIEDGRDRRGVRVPELRAVSFPAVYANVKACDDGR